MGQKDVDGDELQREDLVQDLDVPLGVELPGPSSDLQEEELAFRRFELGLDGLFITLSELLEVLERLL